MPDPTLRTATQTLDEEFLFIRAKLLEVAASLDRIDRGEGNADDDPRIAQIQQAISILQQGEPASNLAEKLQLTFSLPYKNNWQSEFGLC